MKDTSRKVRIVRIANLYFGIENETIEKVKRLNADREEPLPLSSEECEKYNLAYGIDFFGIPAERKGAYIIRFTAANIHSGMIVDEVYEEQTYTPQRQAETRLILGSTGSSAGFVPVIDIVAFHKRLATVSQRRTALFDSIAEVRRPNLQNVEAASAEAARQKQQQANRTRRRTRFYNWFLGVVSSVKTRVAVFLIFLVLASMLGIIFFESGINTAFRSLWDTFWYSIVTITTVGYGDKTPITVGGKIVGLLLMGMGVIVMAAVTGQIASFLVEQQMRRREGLLKLKNLQNHFIICGWRKELDRIIEGILAVNPQYSISDLVLINNVGHEAMQPILQNPQFQGIQYINGDYIEEETLRRANIDRAARVIILADFAQNYSQQEVDSRTVMAVLTIESLTKRVYVAAELLDDKFEKYLKLANCDEIILSREYSKMILANASSASGISHVLQDLLSPQHGSGLEIRTIPDWLVDEPFGKLIDFYNATYGSICIGLLENTGNFYQRKREALNDAQMTPDISKLVENLRTVKELVPNKPVINPGREYKIRKNSRAIVIELGTRKAG
ncbi:MAG: potassium channel family protein [Spirochaetota bacterium]